jgi:hypothetical protein
MSEVRALIRSHSRLFIGLYEKIAASGCGLFALRAWWCLASVRSSSERGWFHSRFEPVSYEQERLRPVLYGFCVYDATHGMFSASSALNSRHSVASRAYASASTSRCPRKQSEVGELDHATPYRCES